jgi:hypothetical protein
MSDSRILFSPEEQNSLITWINDNYSSFKKNDGSSLFLTDVEQIEKKYHNSEIYNIIDNIKTRLIKLENLENTQQCLFLKDLIYVLEPGSKLHNHIDGNNHESNNDLNQTGIHVRFNVCVQKPEFGGQPIYAGKTVKLVEREYIICRSGIDFHSSEYVFGDKNKINISFGFLISPDKIDLYSNRETIVENANIAKSWEFHNSENDKIIPYLNELNADQKYLLNLENNSNYNLLEQHIYDSVIFHNKNVLGDNSQIEFNLIKNKCEMKIENEDDANPALTIVSFFNEPRIPLFISNVNEEQHTYKEFPDDNVFILSIPKKNTQISFDGSKCHGIVKNSEQENPLFLKVNVWRNKKVKNDIVYKNNGVDEKKQTMFFENNNVLNMEIVNTDLFESILYENYEYTKNKDFIEILNCDKNANILIINNFQRKYADYVSIYKKYGDIAEELFPFCNNQCSHLNKKNRFHNNKILTKFLSHDVCYWIINECEKYDKWTINKKKIFNGYYLCLECLPHVFNFILFSSHFLLIQIGKIYDIENYNIEFIIKDIFITKYTKNSYSNKKENISDSFLCLNVQLNSNFDFEGGEIHIENDKMVLNQGDMLIHTGKTLRSNGGVKNGEKYMLTYLLDFKV